MPRTSNQWLAYQWPVVGAHSSGNHVSLETALTVATSIYALDRIHTVVVFQNTREFDQVQKPSQY